MQTSCENCFTVFNVPEKMAVAMACPYCGHIFQSSSEKKKKADGPDQSKTMVNFLDGEMQEENSVVKKIASGRSPGLPPGLEMLVVFHEGDKKGQKFAVRRPTITLGRKNSNIQLNDPEISRHHCVIAAFGESLVLRDLGSSNGTMVNQYIVKEAVLKHQDKIRVGSTVMSVSLRKIP